MPKASRVGVDRAGGLILGGGQSFVRINGKLWTVLGDRVQYHGKKSTFKPTNDRRKFFYHDKRETSLFAGS